MSLFGIATDAATWAAMDNRSLHKWVNDKTPGTTEALVLTDSTLVYNVSAGERVMITGFDYTLDTASDNCGFELGYTDEADGAGTFTALTGHHHLTTGTNKSYRGEEHDSPVPPLVADGFNGARSITFRVEANDTNATISCGWDGFTIDWN